MKKFIITVLMVVALISCDKTSIQETTQNIKRADSLLTKANDGFKTLDSISKTINSDDGIAKKVIIPEIEKQKKAIDSTIKSGSWQIDSINRQIQEITKNVKTGTEVVKTLDSANNALKKGNNPLDVLARTADKILKQTKTGSQNSSPQAKTENPVQSQSPSVPPVVQKNPLVKTARLELEVGNLPEAKALLKQKFRDSNSDLVTENFSQTEGVSKETFTAKVPLSSFDQLVSSATGLGKIRMKSTVSEGIDYDPTQMCDVEISLIGNENLADTTLTKTDDSSAKNDSFGSQSSNAFMQGFETLKNGLLFLLPFWPILLIGILIWYLISKNRRKKQAEILKNNQIHNSRKTTDYEEEATSTTSETNSPKDENKDSGETDYSKYMPKK